MSLVNLTPHPIRVYRDADTIQFVVEPAEKPARLAMIDLGHDRWVSTEDDGTPAYVEWMQFGQCHDLPQPELGTTYIVSLVVALACPGRTDLVFPLNEVRNDDGTVIGCRGFGRVC